MSNQNNMAFSCKETSCTCNYFNYSGGKPEKFIGLACFLDLSSLLCPFRAFFFFLLIMQSLFTLCFIHDGRLFQYSQTSFSFPSRLFFHYLLRCPTLPLIIFTFCISFISAFCPFSSSSSPPPLPYLLLFPSSSSSLLFPPPPLFLLFFVLVYFIFLSIVPRSTTLPIFPSLSHRKRRIYYIKMQKRQ